MSCPKIVAPGLFATSVTHNNQVPVALPKHSGGLNARKVRVVLTSTDWGWLTFGSSDVVDPQVGSGIAIRLTGRPEIFDVSGCTHFVFIDGSMNPASISITPLET